MSEESKADAKLRKKLMPAYRRATEQCWEDTQLAWTPPLSKRQLVSAGFDAGVAFIAHRNFGPNMRSYLRRWWRWRTKEAAERRELFDEQNAHG